MFRPSPERLLTTAPWPMKRFWTCSISQPPSLTRTLLHRGFAKRSSGWSQWFPVGFQKSAARSNAWSSLKSWKTWTAPRPKFFVSSHWEHPMWSAQGFQKWPVGEQIIWFPQKVGESNHRAFNINDSHRMMFCEASTAIRLATAASHEDITSAPPCVSPTSFALWSGSQRSKQPLGQQIVRVENIGVLILEWFDDSISDPKNQPSKISISQKTIWNHHETCYIMLVDPRHDARFAPSFSSIHISSTISIFHPPFSPSYHPSFSHSSPIFHHLINHCSIHLHIHLHFSLFHFSFHSSSHSSSFSYHPSYFHLSSSFPSIIS